MKQNPRYRRFCVKNAIVQWQRNSLTYSKSGKLNASSVRYWRDNVLIPNASKRYLLLSDSWTVQCNKEIYAKAPGCRRLEIPPNITD